MRTVEVTLYKFNELPTEKAKERARNWWREGEEYPHFGEAVGSLKAFCNLFGVSVRDYCIGDDYRSFIKTDAEHQTFRGIKLKNFNRDAMPTGWHFDCSLMYEFCDVFKKTGDAHYAFQQALEQFLIDVRKDVEWHFSDECIDELLEVNEYEFTEEGERA